MDAPAFLLVFLLLPIFLCSPGGASDLESDGAALLAFQAAVGRGKLLWNASAMPCSWVGVTCYAGRVTRIRLPGHGLEGQIPAGTLGNLTALEVVSLRLNALSGPLPSDIVGCKKLRVVQLQGNRFFGEIPSSLFFLQNLVRVNLAINNFTGGISPDFNKLTRLEMLYLERNHLSGEIPDLDLPRLVWLNVSFNALIGSIPARLRRMSSDAFLGTSLCGVPLGACPGEKSKLSSGAIAGISIGAVVGLLIVAALFVLICLKSKESVMAMSRNVAVENKNARSARAMDLNWFEKGLVFLRPVAKAYDLEDLLRASAEVLGKGTLATTYKAILETEMEMVTVVAVKRLKDVNLSQEEFHEKVQVIGLMDHPNVVRLHAFYYSMDDKLLVYDYIPMGSLSSILHANPDFGRVLLDWDTRCGIALDAARGIEHIHSMGPGVSHGNIKSSNVLLDDSFEAHVSDYCLADIGSPSDGRSHAAGYRAPEVTDARKVSQKGDVYGFGALLLELLTGKHPAQGFHDEDGADLPRWVRSVVREEFVPEVFDVELLTSQNVEEMTEMLQLAMDCAAHDPGKRPSMSEVVVRIEEIRRSSMGSMGRNHRRNRRSSDDTDDRSSKEEARPRAFTDMQSASNG